MDRWIIDDTPGTKFPAWTRGNAADVFPEPVSPLMATLYLRQMGYAVRDAYVEMGVYDYDELEQPHDPTVFGVFGGYVYNALSLIRLFGARLPGASPEAIDKAFFDDRDDVPPYQAEPWHESERHSAKLAETVGWVLSTPSLPELDRDKALADGLRAGRPDLASLDVPALLARAKSLVPLLRQVFDTGMIASTLASVGPGALGALCEALGDPTLSIRLLAGIEADSAEPPKVLWDLSRRVRASAPLTEAFAAGPAGLDARLRALGEPDAQAFVTAFDEFLFRYGSRCPNEWDMLAPSWEVRPDIALAAVDRMRFVNDEQSPALRRAAVVAERDAIVADVRSRLAADPESAGLFDNALRSAAVFLSGRERYKTNAIKIVNELRVALREVGQQMVERECSPTWRRCSCCERTNSTSSRVTPNASPRWSPNEPLNTAIWPRSNRRSSSTAGALPSASGSGGWKRLPWPWPSPERSYAARPAPAGLPKAEPESSWTRRIPPSWNRVTCWWRPRPTRPGRRCSCRPPP
jgi:rifampicin phosphotransferase